MPKPREKKKKKNTQDNIGYENTQKRNDDDTQENDRVETTDTGHNEGPKERKNDSAGLRSESGSKTRAGESGNKEVGWMIIDYWLFIIHY